MKKIGKMSSLLFLVSPLIPWTSISLYENNYKANVSTKTSSSNEVKKFNITSDNSILNYNFDEKVLVNSEMRFYYSDIQNNTIPINTSTGPYSINSYCAVIKNGEVNYPFSACVIDSWWSDSGWAVGPKFWDSSYYNTINGPDYSYHMANKEIVKVQENNKLKRIFNENLAASFSGKHNGVYRYRVTQFKHGDQSQNPFNFILVKDNNGDSWKSMADIGNSDEYGGALQNQYSYNTYNSFRSLTELKNEMVSPKKSGSVAEIDLGIYDREIYLSGSESKIRDIHIKDESYKKYDINSFYNSINSVDDLNKFLNIDLLDTPKACISDSKGENSSIEIIKDEDNQQFIVKFTTANSFLAPLNFSRDEGTPSNSSYEINETEWINDQPITKSIELPFSEFSELVTTDIKDTVKKTGISITGKLSSKLASEIISATPETEVYIDLKKWISQNSEYIFVGYPTESVPIENILSIKRSEIPGNDTSVKIGITIKDALTDNIPTEKYFEFNINGFLKVFTDLSNKRIDLSELSNIPLSDEYINENKTKIEKIIENNFYRFNIHVPSSCKVSVDLSESTFTSTISGVLNNIKINLSEYYNNLGEISSNGYFILDVSGFAIANPIATFKPITNIYINNNENIRNVNEQYLKEVIFNNNVFQFSEYFPLTLNDISSINYEVDQKTGKVNINSISYNTYNDKGEKNLSLDNQISDINLSGFIPYEPWYEEYFNLLLISGIVLFFIILIIIIIISYRNKNRRRAMSDGLGRLPKNKNIHRNNYLEHVPPHVSNKNFK